MTVWLQLGGDRGVANKVVMNPQLLPSTLTEQIRFFQLIVWA